MLQAVFLVLGLLGSWGALSAVHRGVVPRLARRRARKTLLGGSNPYYFRAYTVGARVDDTLRVWRFCREVEVVSKARALSHLDLQATFGSDVEYRGLQVHPADFSFERGSHPDPVWSRFVIRFPRSLAAGECTRFVFTGLARLSAEGRRVVAFSPADRVDALTLRIVFETPPDGAVYYRIQNAQHQSLHEELLTVDRLTNEARVVVPHPVPHLTHQIVW